PRPRWGWAFDSNRSPRSRSPPFARFWRTELPYPSKSGARLSRWSLSRSTGRMNLSGWRRARCWSDIARSWANQSTGRSLLFDVRIPANDSPHGERRGEQSARDADEVEEHRRIEFD